MRSVNAIGVAKWFIWKNYTEQLENIIDGDTYEVYEGITHLKVQKLLYYAQGIFLAIYNFPLFNESILAWPHGPVVKDVYSTFCDYGRSDIPFDDSWLEEVNEIESNEQISEILNLTYDNYGGYTAWQLREKSHIEGGPWQVTVDTIGMNKIIKNDMIKKYFRENIVSNE